MFSTAMWKYLWIILLTANEGAASFLDEACDFGLLDDRAAQTRRIADAVHKYESNPLFRAEAVEVGGHKTIRVFSSVGRIPEGAKARVLLLHGMGATYSNHGAMLELVKNLADRRPTKKKGVRRWIMERAFPVFGVEAIDLVGHGAGPLRSELNTLDANVEWLAAYIRKMREETPNLPIIVISRSASPLFAVEVAARYPGLIDKNVLLSPTLPGSKELLKHHLPGLVRIATRLVDPVGINFELLSWYDDMAAKVVWTPERVGAVPTLIFTGEKDSLEMMTEERDHYRFLADHNGGKIIYSDIPGVAHDVFPNDIKRAQVSYEQLFSFLLSP